MALGKPVMATNVEGVAELLGITADEQAAAWRDTDAFVQKLVALARDPARCERLGTRNQGRAQEHFSAAAMVEAYARLYERLASS
jgi:glycosyltransferase involved in cell wall biosynthesis